MYAFVNIQGAHEKSDVCIFYDLGAHEEPEVYISVPTRSRPTSYSHRPVALARRNTRSE